MTSDIGPDTVCNFTVGDTATHFNQRWVGDVWVDSDDVYDLTQLHDAYNYAQTEIGYQPQHASLLIGRLANFVTNANGTTDSGQPKTAYSEEFVGEPRRFREVSEAVI
jgi:hypothetical protein